MIMRAIPLLVALACLGSALVVQAQTQAPKAPDATESSAEKNGLKISISPTSNDKDDNVIVFRPRIPYINVVLQNTSAKPLNIFDEWNSFGAYNLTLKITKVDGKILDEPIIVARDKIPWFSNSASFETIDPGKDVTRSIHLYMALLGPMAPDEYLGPKVPGRDSRYFLIFHKHFPLPDKDSERHLTISAVFENKRPTSYLSMKDGHMADIEGETTPMWTGKIESPPTDYRIYWGSDTR